MTQYKKPKYARHEPMDISFEQEKVISNPFRSRLIALLYDKAMTPKQVADMVDKNPGTVYYHIQQLMKHNILEIEHTETEKGVVEKYYRSKAALFKNTERESPSNYVTGAESNMYLSDDLLKSLKNEMEALLFKYGKLSYEEKDDLEQHEYTFEYLIKEFKEGEEE